MLSKIKAHQNRNPFLHLLFMHLFIISLIFFIYHRCNLEFEREAKSQEIITATSSLSKSFYDAALAIGAYGLTKNAMFVERYQKLSTQISLSTQTIHTLIKDQSINKTDCAETEQLVQQGLNQLSNAKTILDENQLSSFGSDNSDLRNLYKQIKLTADQLQSKLDQLSQTEQKILQNSPHYKMVNQVLLALTLTFYAIYNLSIQYRLIKKSSIFSQSVNKN